MRFPFGLLLYCNYVHLFYRFRDSDLLIESLRFFVLPTPVSFEAFAGGFPWDESW